MDLKTVLGIHDQIGGALHSTERVLETAELNEQEHERLFFARNRLREAQAEVGKIVDEEGPNPKG